MLDETGLWRDVTELPSTLAETLDGDRGRERCRDAARGARRPPHRRERERRGVLRRGRPLARLARDASRGPEVVAVPSGLLARGAFAWRPGDVLLVISSSGEFRDLVEAVDAGAPAPYAAVTANAESTLGARAGARALVSVPNQRAVTHTQAFCGAVVAALSVWAEMTGDAALDAALRRLPAELEIAIARARTWVDEPGRDGARDGGRLRQRPCVGRRARGRAAPQGGRRAPGRRRRDQGGGDLGDDGARPRRSGAEPDRGGPRIRSSPRPRTSAPDRGRP